MGVYEVVTKRRSIRRFKDITVAYNILERCVNAARLAPTAMNHQLCDYIVVDDEQLLPRVFDTITTWAGEKRPKGGSPPGHRPKAYIITLINSPLEAELNSALQAKLDGTKRVVIYDVGMAIENMILVALEQGIGTCPILSFNQDGLKQILNIPDNYEIALVLALGYSDESPVVEVTHGSVKYWVDNKGVRHVPKRELKDVIHRNKFP